MLGFFQKIPVHVKLYPNEIEVTDLRTNRTIRRIANQKFSSSRMLLADFHTAESLIKSTLGELGLRDKMLKVAAQQMVDLGGGISATEQRQLRDTCEFVGSAFNILLLHTREVPAAEVLGLLELKREELPTDVIW
ncbi:hypothetical protein [Hymenobacter tenuis]